MVKVNQETCIGCGLCASVCEDNFKMNDDMKAEVISSKDSDCLKEAIESCPVDAISK